MAAVQKARKVQKKVVKGVHGTRVKKVGFMDGWMDGWMRTSVHGSGYAPKMDLEGGRGGSMYIEGNRAALFYRWTADFNRGAIHGTLN